jgi:hypothetical protein
MTVTADARTHKDAVLALLDAIANLDVYDGEPTDVPTDAGGAVNPYAALYGGAGTRFAGGLDGASVDFDWPFQVTAVGGDPNECLWAVDKVCAALLDVQPTVAGRSTWRIYQDGEPGPVRQDPPTVSPRRYYVPLLFRLGSTPA